MSSNVLDSVIVPLGELVRDFLWTHDGTAVNRVFDVVQSFNTLGLDIFLRNRGAAAITVSLNGGPAVTVDPGDVYTVNGFKFWLVTITSAVIYDAQIFGIRVNTLKRMGLM